MKALLQGLLFTGCLLLGACPQEKDAAQTDGAKSKSAPWSWPEDKPDGARGERVRYGEQLVAHTPKYLGPAAESSALRLAGNALACSNCHLSKGTQANALGFVGVAHRYPAYYAPLGREVSLAERINACFERSLNAQALPAEGREIQAFVAYMEWLSEKVPQDQLPVGAGLPQIDLPQRKANLVAGEAIYRASCQACHGEQGLGLLRDKAAPGAGYTFPPVAGPDSYGQGSNMARLSVAARYIHANMPLGRAVLTAGEAYDVAAYMNSLPRPEFTGSDYPVLSDKPFDVPYGPWPDQAPAEQHRLGPLPRETLESSGEEAS